MRKLDIQASKLCKKLHMIQRELEERQNISRDNREDFESVFTYGMENMPYNPLDEIENETLVSDIECKRALI